MAVMETKIVQVTNSPESIDASNSIWESFGWNVLSVQVTHSQNTKTYTAHAGDGYNTVETTTINYATITYQRDKQMPNYTDLKELERQYQALQAQIDSLKAREPKTTYNILDVIQDEGAAFNIHGLFGLILKIMFWPITLITMIVNSKTVKDKIAEHRQPEEIAHDQWYNEMEALQKQQSDIRSQAEALLIA